jgi:hypothetical protein
MSDDQIRLHLKELNRLLEVKYPPLSGRVKLCRLPNNPKKIDIVGNEAGIVMWSMAMASSVILKAEMKPDIPGCLIVLDENWMTQDSELRVANYSCDETFDSKQIWHDQLLREKNRSWKDKSKEAIGCVMGCAFMLFILYCIVSTVFGWFH